MHCTVSLTNITTYTHTYTHTHTHITHMHCAALRCNARSQWHGDIIEHVNNGGGEGRLSWPAEGPLGMVILLCFVPRPWQQLCRSRRTWGLYARLPGFQPTQPTAHKGADTARRQHVLPYIRGPTKSHMQQGEVLLLQVQSG